MLSVATPMRGQAWVRENGARQKISGVLGALGVLVHHISTIVWTWLHGGRRWQSET